MDRRRARTLRAGRLTRILPAGLAPVALGGLAMAAVLPIQSARWIASGADKVAALSRRPVECLGPTSLRSPDWSVEIGRAAFRTPLLLGGQAARAGLSCESCHINGRTNPTFFFPGLSGAPGTADVTSALFSSHRDDGIDNPKPIPDLGGPKDRLRIDQAHESAALRQFIRGLVVEEFDGAEPPPAVLDGLTAYVRALDPAQCPAKADEPVRASASINDTRRAVRAAALMLSRGDVPTAALLIEAAQSQLARIDERYSLPGLSGDRSRLRAASLDLSSALADVRAGRARSQSELGDWLVRLPLWSRDIERDEGRSLYDPRVIQARLAAR